MSEEIISFNQEKCLDDLRCPICFNIFEDPIMELPNQHIMCRKCLMNYSKKLNNNILDPFLLFCPFCKTQIKEIITPRFVINLLNYVEMKCLSEYQNEKCDWKGNAIEYYNHLKDCEIFEKNRKEKIKNVCDKMREILGKEITPHLKKEHLDIFNEHVKEWNWLDEDNKDWKWWWWCDMPWWKNKPCEECNKLWLKYEDEIQIYESKRVDLLTSK